MNTRDLSASAWLCAIGGGAVLIIGALAHFDPAGSPRPDAAAPPDPPPLTQDVLPAELPAEPALPADLPPGLSQIIKLAQAQVDESVILAYVKNSGQVFSLTADEILYLSDLGLSQDVIGALVRAAPPAAIPPVSRETAAARPSAPVPGTPPPAASLPEPDSNAGIFYNDLAPYGTWAEQPGYGFCWQPTVETMDPNWRPYVDAGQWLYSDSGWYWQSAYTWGWAVFHYGRWANVPHRGWLWAPGKLWAPAWVAWRSTPSYIGWAPLPPGVSLNVLAQLTFHGRPAAPNATLGLASSSYTFVSPANLTSRNLPRRAVPAPRVNDLIQNSTVIDSYAIIDHRIFNGGTSPDAVAAAARKAVPEVILRAVSSPEAAGLAMDRKTLAVYQPDVYSARHSPPSPVLADKHRAQATAENSTSHKLVGLSEREFDDDAPMPDESDNGNMAVQLPPLRYPAPPNASAIRRHHRQVIMASAPDSTTARRDGARGFGTAAVEHPATSPPRLDGLDFNPSARRAEPRRIALESPPAPVETERARVEGVRVVPAPAAGWSPSGASRSGK